MLTIWWCPCVESSIVLLEEVVCYEQCLLLANLLLAVFLLHFVPQRPNLPFTPGISWLSTFEFQSCIMKNKTFLVLVLKGLVGLPRTDQLQLLQHYWLGHRLGLLNCLPWKQTEFILSFFETASKYCISDSFADYMGRTSLEELILKLKLQSFDHRYEELTHWERPWCWEWSKAGGEGHDRGWDCHMVPPTQWTWVLASSESQWWTGKPGVLQSMWSQSRTGMSTSSELN